MKSGEIAEACQSERSRRQVLPPAQMTRFDCAQCDICPTSFIKKARPVLQGGPHLLKEQNYFMCSSGTGVLSLATRACDTVSAYTP